MVKLVFAPIGIVAGLIAGVAARRGFERIWGVIDSEEPPQPDQRQASVGKLIIALALEGAVFRVVKGVADNGARRAVARYAGRWPGEDESAAE